MQTLVKSRHTHEWFTPGTSVKRGPGFFPVTKVSESGPSLDARSRREPFMRVCIALVAMLMTLSASAFGAEPGTRDLVRASLLANVEATAPGGTFTLGVRLKMKEHWHTYWINPGETGNATQFKLHGPAGIEFGAVQWPLPTRIDAVGGICYGYENDVLFLIPVTVGKDFAAKEASISVDVEWVTCQKEECVEGSAKLAVNIPISQRTVSVNSDLFAMWTSRLPGDGKATTDHLASATELKGSDGLPTGLDVQWKEPAPAKVDFFPISTNAAAIQNVVASQTGALTHITFKTVLYSPEKVPQGKLDGLLVFENSSGRHGIPISVRVTK